MRRIMLVALVCLLANAGAAAQKAPAVDCSTMDDATITANVKDKFLNSPSLKNADIKVSTEAGTVTLTGLVKTSGLKSAATRLTKKVNCVKQVNNQLEVEQKRGAKKPKD